MNALEIFNFNLEEIIKNAILEQKECCFYFVPNNTTAFVGYGNDVDEQIAKRYGVDVFRLNNEGGVIVSDSGSLVIGTFFKENKDFNKKLAFEICQLLIERGHNASIIGNDVIVDQTYKVTSYSSRRFGDIIFGAFQVPFTVNLPLINALCKKEMKKIPRGLSEYGIGFQEVFKLFKNFITFF